MAIQILPVGIAAVVGVVLIKKCLFPKEEPKMTAKHVETIQKLIKSSNVFVASKSSCPFCVQTKRTLGSFGAKPTVLELDHEGMYLRLEN